MELMNVVGNTGSFVKDVFEFAAPGLLIGGTALLSLSPIYFGGIVVSVASLFWLIVLMLVLGVGYAILKKFLISQLETVMAPSSP